MTVASRHSLYGVRVYTDAMGGAVLLGGITQQAVATGTEVQNEPTSGEVFSRFLSMTSQKPSAAFSTLGIAAALDVIGLSGLAITAATNAGLELFAYKHAAGSTRAGNSSHRKYNLKKGIIIPQRLTCEHQGNAVLSYLALAIYDGTNDPVVLSESVTLPTGITDAQRFALGPVTIGGIALAGKLGLEIDFGVKAEAISSDGEIWDTLVTIVNTVPKITLRGIDIAWWHASGIPLAGKAATHANTAMYLRKRAVAGKFVADATSEHISLTAAGLAFVEDQSASGAAAKTTSISAPLYYDGTNDPLVIDTTAAIP
jgi:hypothetical protein